jgi:hypothetical protein
MKDRLARVCLCVFLGLSFAGFAPFDAGRPEPTRLRFQTGLDFQIGDEIGFLLLLETERGDPLAAQPIDLFLEDEYAGTVETDALGAAVFSPDRVLLPGQYSIEAVYPGIGRHLPAVVSTMFRIAPAEIVVQTVPVIPGLIFALDGRTAPTGADGIARFSVESAGAFTLELLPNESVLAEAGAVFKQWDLGGLDHAVTVIVPGETRLEAGFEISFPGLFVFVDPDREAIPVRMIESVELRGSDGSVYTFSAGESLQLQANRILVRLNGLDSVAVVHSVQSVIVDGVDVVNRGQQRFIFTPGLPVEIELLFYDVRFYARDLVLGRPIGTGLELIYPDGASRIFTFDEGGEILLAGLARGEYEARLLTREGIAPSFPIVLSRDQEVRLPVIGYADLLAGLAAGGSIIVGLPLFGRRARILDFIREFLRPAERKTD